jgi:hypothetical protein
MYEAIFKENIDEIDEEIWKITQKQSCKRVTKHIQR